MVNLYSEFIIYFFTYMIKLDRGCDHPCGCDHPFWHLSFTAHKFPCIVGGHL